jgi:hypothetical protein
VKTGDSLLSSQHKGEEEERSEQRKTRHEKGHSRSMFLNQDVQHLYHATSSRKPPGRLREGIPRLLRRILAEARTNAVAAWQQHQFVWCSMQLAQGPRRLAEGLGNEGNTMRIFMVFAITMAAAIGLGGCFWHHQAAVVTQPAPPLK